MRWKQPEIGDYRIISMFLWFPRTVQGETRWFEFAQIKQIYVVLGWDEMWADVEWIDQNS